MSLLIWREESEYQKSRRNHEAGFLLAEAAVICIALASAALFAAFYQTLNRQRIYSEAAVTASFLAGEQLAHIEAKNAAFLGSASNLPWLGEGSNPVNINGHSFQISSEISHDDPEFCNAKVTVTWEEDGRTLSETRERAVAYHD